jgi:tetratricopeptide (TPR) repeat protein
LSQTTPSRTITWRWRCSTRGTSREALKEFQAALKLRPKWAEAHYGIGAVWYDLQDKDAAIKELRTAEALDPLHAATHRLLARILAQQNNLADAEHELKLALRLKPSARDSSRPWGSRRDNWAI